MGGSRGPLGRLELIYGARPVHIWVRGRARHHAGPSGRKKRCKILSVSAPPARQHRPLIAPAPDRASASARPVKFTLIFLARPCEQQRSRRRAAQRPEKYAVEFMPAPGDPEHGPYATHCPPDMKRRQAAHEHHRSKPRQHTTATRDKQTVKHGALPPQALSCVSVSAQVPTTPPRATKPARGRGSSLRTCAQSGRVGRVPAAPRCGYIPNQICRATNKSVLAYPAPERSHLQRLY